MTSLVWCCSFACVHVQRDVSLYIQGSATKEARSLLCMSYAVFNLCIPKLIRSPVRAFNAKQLVQIMSLYSNHTIFSRSPVDAKMCLVLLGSPVAHMTFLCENSAKKKCES